MVFAPMRRPGIMDDPAIEGIRKMHGGKTEPRARAPLGLIGMTVLVVAVESWLSSHSLELSQDRTLFEWRATGIAARGEEVKRSEVLCFGDSLVKYGIYPPILEASLGRSAFNLAVQGCPPPVSYFLLRRALDGGARPKAVIVDVHAMVLPSRPDQTVACWPEFLTEPELV
jgi:hypothetical protein